MKQMIVPAAEMDYWNKWLKENQIDFNEVDFDYDSTLFCQTVAFDDGTQADLKVCSGQTNLWCEMVWFDRDGNEIACSDACADALDGIWEFPVPFEGDEYYNVEVVRG